MLPIRIEQDSIRIGRHLRVTFQRTLRIPDDGNEYPLPPGLGRFPVLRVMDYAETVPESWLEDGGIFIPMYQCEALWLDFDQAWWRPAAVKIGLGEVDALSGTPWTEDLHSEPQNYLVCPDQPWLDGINAGDGFVRQFVAARLGHGHTVEGQITGKETGGMKIRAIEPRVGLFPEDPPPLEFDDAAHGDVADMACMSCDMGIAAGGRMRQEIYPDPHGIATWDEDSAAEIRIRIISTVAFKQITGLNPPPSPISAHVWTELGLPWFEFERPGAGDIDPSEELALVKSIAEMEATGDGDKPLQIGGRQVRKLG